MIVIFIDAPSGDELLSTEPYHSAAGDTPASTVAIPCVQEVGWITRRIDGKLSGDIELAPHADLPALNNQNIAGAQIKIYHGDPILPGASYSSGLTLFLDSYIASVRPARDGGYYLTVCDRKSFPSPVTTWSSLNGNTAMWGALKEAASIVYSGSWQWATLGTIPGPGDGLIAVYKSGTSQAFSYVNFAANYAYHTDHGTGDHTFEASGGTNSYDLGEVTTDLVGEGSFTLESATATALASLITVSSDGLGFYSNAGDDVFDLIDILLGNSLGCVWHFTRTSPAEIQARQVVEPSTASADATITEDDIVIESLQAGRIEPAMSSMSFTIALTYGLDGLSSKYGATYSDTTVWTNSGDVLKNDVTVATFWSDYGTAQDTEVARRGAIRAQPRKIFNLVAQNVSTLEVGQVISITHFAVPEFETATKGLIHSMGLKPDFGDLARLEVMI